MKSKFRWPRERFPPLMTSMLTYFFLTLPSSPSSFSDSLVKVRAQVMTRDESTEGWLPLQGGGLANVSIRKRARMPDVGGHEYIIYGQRISDQTVNSLSLKLSTNPWNLSTILGHSELCHQSRSSVLQSHANIPPLASGQTTKRSHISNCSWRESFRQGNHQSLRRSYRR